MITRAACIFFLLISLLPALALARPLSPDEQTTTLSHASEQFRLGVSKLESDRDVALGHLDAAISSFERLTQEGNIQNGRLYYNLGNAYLLRGDIGRAILNYRRAQRLIPSDANLQENLLAARQRVGTRIEAGTESLLRRIFLFWHDDVSPNVRWSIFLGAYLCGWLFFALRATNLLRIIGWWPAILCAALALAMGASLLFERYERANHPEAVIIAKEVTGRKGPDDSAYEPSFTEPLLAGVELRLLEERSDWVLVRLSDGRETWIRSQAIDRIDRPRPATP